MSREGQVYLKSLFIYCPLTGLVINRIRRNPRADIYNEAGSLQHCYLQVAIDKKNYLLHRIIWYYMTGDWPKLFIDHIDGNKLNNSWSNLREVTAAENSRNLPCHREGKSVGLTYSNGKWVAKGPRLSGTKQKTIGYFVSKEAAQEAYIKYMKGVPHY